MKMLILPLILPHEPQQRLKFGNSICTMYSTMQQPLNKTLHDAAIIAAASATAISDYNTRNCSESRTPQPQENHNKNNNDLHFI